MIINASLMDALPLIPRDTIDSCVTDPPYHMASLTKRLGKPGSAPIKIGATGAYRRAAAGFMGQEWDGGNIASDPATWAAVWRVLKPGAHMVAFSGSRTYHRMACAIQDAGFEIRDQIMWLYGSGFPKSHKVGDGQGTALKPAHEPIVLARKPISESSIAKNVLRWGTGGLAIDACRVGTDMVGWGGAPGGGGTWNDSNSGLGQSGAPRPVQGRHPANLIQTDALAGQPFERYFYHAKASHSDRVRRCEPCGSRHTGKGTICPACGVMLEPGHPTVKPLALMEYLCRLATPAGGTIIDPFAGTGSTLLAARNEGFEAIGIERERLYFDDMKWRLAL